MAIDKLHWLPIHSVMLMFDQLSLCCLLTLDQPVYMSGNALPFVGNFYMYLIVFANTIQIETNIKYMPL